jgi:hypothetical protein
VPLAGRHFYCADLTVGNGRRRHEDRSTHRLHDLQRQRGGAQGSQVDDNGFRPNVHQRSNRDELLPKRAFGRLDGQSSFEIVGRRNLPD